MAKMPINGKNSAELNEMNSDQYDMPWCSNDISAGMQHLGEEVLDSNVYEVYPPSAGTVPEPKGPQAM